MLAMATTGFTIRLTGVPYNTTTVSSPTVTAGNSIAARPTEGQTQQRLNQGISGKPILGNAEEAKGRPKAITILTSRATNRWGCKRASRPGWVTGPFSGNRTSRQQCAWHGKFGVVHADELSSFSCCGHLSLKAPPPGTTNLLESALFPAYDLWRKARVAAVRRLETGPGKEARVDWSHLGWLQERRQRHLWRSRSRLAGAEERWLKRRRTRSWEYY